MENIIKKSSIKKLVIDGDYIATVGNVEGLHAKLKEDLSKLGSSDEVHLVRPSDRRLTPVFADALSYVCGQAATRNGDGYIIKPTNEYDVRKIVAILGGNVVGGLQEGYRFSRKRG